MSWEGCALQILRACIVSSQQMIQFLQPFQGRLPQDEAEFALLSSHMRRIGHIFEHSPNNLGQLLHGSGRQPQESTTQIPLWVTCRPLENLPQEAVSCGQTRQQHRVGIIGSPTLPQVEATAGETQSIRWLFPDSGRMMGKAPTEQVPPLHLTVAPNTST